MDDPAADFLAREQAILGADAALFATDDITSSANPAPLMYDAFDNDISFGEPISAPPVSTFVPEPAELEIEVETEAVNYWAMVRKWRENFAALVAERDARSQTKHQETLASAKESLERFYAEYNEKKAKAVSKNKEAEALLLNREDTSAGGNIWEKVVKQIELSSTSSINPARDTKKTGKDDRKDDKAAKKPATKLKDTSRLKSLLVSLKNDKNAPGNVAA
ncbi:hypothetical protein HDU67_007643 [Dinochytrium kinnereticum]|nr:hypothetical protein HDU67_007643 [Dinochytrium kinnereticum]